MGRGDGPRLGKSELDVTRIGGRELEGNGLRVPLGVGFGDVKATAAGQANFDQGERPAAVIAKTIFGFEVNDGLWVRSELNADFLLFDEIAGAAGSVAAREEGCGRREREKEKEARMSDRGQSAFDCSGGMGLRQKRCGQCFA